ncbi:MAG: tetratricopeptide repeat protein [Spirochaetes bacterium]|nr:tetratricopeptide repeat protein [Spirochaetota bacterium]
MSTKVKSTEKAKNIDEPNFFTKLNDFLRKNRIIIVSLFALLLVIVAGIGVWSAVSASRLKNATALLEKIEAEFESWQSAVDEDKTKLEESILAISNELAAKYKKLYPALRSRNLSASIFISRNDFTRAIELYKAIYETAPDSHLAPLAMYNAAIAQEKNGDVADALVTLETIYTDYPGVANINRVLFNIGRLYEANEQYTEAYQNYTKIIVKGGVDDWTKLAQSRIIYFDSRGIGK